jgi:drug/metabolite transporter (DMT)-like permease
MARTTFVLVLINLIIPLCMPFVIPSLQLLDCTTPSPYSLSSSSPIYPSQASHRFFSNQLEMPRFHRYVLTAANDISTSDSSQVNKDTPTSALTTFPFISLLITSFLWGTYGIGMKYLYIAASPPQLLFNLAAAAFSSVALIIASSASQFKKSVEITAISSNVKRGELNHKFQFSPARLAGLELGGYLFIASTFQIFGLGLTTAGHSAFIIQLATVFAPLLQALVYRKMPSMKSFISCVIAFFGVVLLTSASGSGSNSGGIVTNSMLIGDALSVLAAVIYGFHVVRLGFHAPRFEPMVLANMKEQSRFQISLVTYILIACLPVAMTSSHSLLRSTMTFLQTSPAKAVWAFVSIALWQGIFVTAIPTFLQSIGQSIISANTAAVLYATTPLWSTIFEFFVFGEQMCGREYLGAALLIMAVLLA